MLSTRATPAEAALVVAAATQEGATKADFIHEAVMAAARRRLGVVEAVEMAR